MKFIAPKIELAPAKCRLKIPKSTAAPECASIPLSGGYTVQPVPTPTSTKLENNSNVSAGGSNQKLRLFNRGNAISGAPNNIGTNQLPKPPINIGITMKKIMINACAVTRTLYSWALPIKNSFPGVANSSLIKKDKAVPIIPENIPKIK